MHFNISSLFSRVESQMVLRLLAFVGVFALMVLADSCDYYSCYQCTTAPSGNCGWCASTSTCSQGSVNGPTSGSCANWDWQLSECPGSCNYDNCYSCTTTGKGTCGWCKSYNQCLQGTASGPTGAFCPAVNWDWNADQCPPGAGIKKADGTFDH